MSDNNLAIVDKEKHGVPAVIPDDVFNINVFRACERIARVMSTTSLVPKHLNNKLEDCFVIAQQSYRWKVDPFAVAQCTSLVQGKLCYEGKLVASIVEKLAGVTLNYEYEGEGENRAVKVIGKRKSDEKPVDIKIKVRDVKTTNEKWKTMPDQMLAYRGSREWARRYTPGVLLGIYTDDELQTEATLKNVTPTTTVLDNFEEKFADVVKEDNIEIIEPEKVEKTTPLSMPTITVNIGTGFKVESYEKAAETILMNMDRYPKTKQQIHDDNKELIAKIYEVNNDMANAIIAKLHEVAA
jgi:hypothetical protein